MQDSPEVITASPVLGPSCPGSASAVNAGITEVRGPGCQQLDAGNSEGQGSDRNMRPNTTGCVAGRKAEFWSVRVVPFGGEGSGLGMFGVCRAEKGCTAVRNRHSCFPGFRETLHGPAMLRRMTAPVGWKGSGLGTCGV